MDADRMAKVGRLAWLPGDAESTEVIQAAAAFQSQS